MKGKLIVFEGVEGSGKTTQVAKLQKWLNKNHPKLIVHSTREPGGTALGKKLREILLNRERDSICDRAELLIFAADRTQHCDLIRQWLERGAIVLCDRFVGSTIAYQGYGRGTHLDLIEQINAIATNGLNPDLTFWLDLDVKIGLERVKKRGERDRMEQNSLEFHRRVEYGFSEYFSAKARTIWVDANQDEEAIADQISSFFSNYMIHL